MSKTPKTKQAPALQTIDIRALQDVSGGAINWQYHATQALLLGLQLRDLVFLALDLDAEQLLRGVGADALHHLLEQREAGLLVFLLRVLLAVALKTDAFAERVHRLEVLDPLLVDLLEREV